ncbi:hypothetical protein OC861_002737 [Tilletia horrida]|nr:hypothetical protein OC861_002737 [Tilletia horrida]
MTADAAIIDAARAWLAKDPDSVTKTQLQHALDNSQHDQLQAAFGERISFGTAGLRAAMGYGPARMNRLIIIETTAGLASHLLSSNSQAKQQGVVIAYDGRHGSKDFAETAAGVLIASGIKVYLFSEPTPTPLGAFATRTLGAAAGIVVTASHNPPQDNGYKVYWHGGAQINSPLDSQIATAIQPIAASSALPPIASLEEPSTASLLTRLDRSLFESYSKDTLASFPPPSSRSAEAQSHAKLGIAYTPMHGVGAPFAEELLRRSGYPNVHTVKEQREPDGDFPTVKFPNPEEPGAMDLVIALANSTSPPATVAIANDPDADRLSACARLPHSGEMKQLTGDQVGAILGDELMRRFKHAAGGGGDEGEVGWVLTTIVSSRLLARLASSYGVEIRECLTGFKWLGTVARAIEQQPSSSSSSSSSSDDDARKKNKFLFAYEEALGYMVQPHVWDKDGLSALLLISSIAAELNAQSPPRTLWDRLEEIHRKAGLSVTIQKTIRLAPGTAGSAVMTKLRKVLENAGDGASLPLKFALVDDLLDRQPASGGAQDLERIVREKIIPKNDVLRFYVDNGSSGLVSADGDQGAIELSAPRIIVRPSGTEPKVKIYCEALGSVDGSQGESYRDAEARVRKELEDIVSTFYDWVSAL